MDTKEPKKVKEILSDTASERHFHNEGIRGEAKKIHLGGVRAFYNHRKFWSIFIMIAIGVIISFDITLIILVGKDVLNLIRDLFTAACGV
jgi:hypothetical protein